MKNNLLLPALGIGVLFLLSKSGAASSKQSNVYAISPTDYIKRYMPFAYLTESIYKVPALVTISQGGLESGWGNSDLARNANNHFGIKAVGWKGAAYNNFRKYNSVQSSFNDHALF